MSATQTRAVIEATGFDVYMAGEKCALHCYSRTGTTVIILPLREFMQKARRDVDGNRRFFPEGRPAPVTPPPSGRGWKGGTLPPARLEAYRNARRDYEQGGTPRKRAALRYGVAPHSFMSWLRKERARERAGVEREQCAQELLRDIVSNDTSMAGDARLCEAIGKARALLGIRAEVAA